MNLFESLNLAKHALLKEFSPIKDLISKVNNNKIIPTDKEKFFKAVTFYKNYSNKKIIEPFSSEFKENNKFDVNKWINKTLDIAEEENFQNLIKNNKIIREKGYDILINNNDYILYAIYSSEAIVKLKNQYAFKGKNDNFKIKKYFSLNDLEKEAEKGVIDFSDIDLFKCTSNNYINNIKNANYYIEPVWCIVSSESENAWSNYGLTDYNHPRVFLLISKNNSNFRFVITVDKSGDIEEAKDPLQNYTTEENINLISKIFNINNLNEFIKQFVFNKKYSNNKNLIKNSVNFYSLYDGNYEQIKTLLSVKPSLINKEYKNKTPLTLRCYKIDKELPKIISLFLNYKADINGNNNDSPLNALLSTINKDNWKIGKKAIELLINNNADINKISETNKNILKIFI